MSNITFVRARRGFSLAEILIALAIVAVLAAVMLPALNSQITKSEGSRAANDLVAVQTGAQAFITDVHRLPQSITQLTTPLVVGVSQDLGIPGPPQSANIPDYLVARWKGPYLAKSFVGSTGAGAISDAFSIVVGPGNINYLTISMTGVPAKEYEVIEKILDEGSADVSSSTAGVIRLSGTTLTFLAVPII